MVFDNYLLDLENDAQKNKEQICLHGCSRIIQSIYHDIKEECNKKTIKTIKEKLGTPYLTFYCWVKGSNPIPISKSYNLLNLWKEICGKTELEFREKWNLFYEQNGGYSQNGQRKVILPKGINNNLGYLIGFFQGDGNLTRDNMNSSQEYSISYYESDKKVLLNINKILCNEFGAVGNIYSYSDKKGGWYTLRLSSKPIYLFFKNILGLQSGRKIRNVLVPKIIQDSDLPIQLSFIRGFFDAEGTVGESSKNPWLEVGQASSDSPSKILLWIRNKLNDSGIFLSEPQKVSNQEFYRLRTGNRECIKRFFDIVSSDHHKKINRFEKIIEKC